MTTDDTWIRLARQYKVRLPHTETLLTTGKMEQWLKKLNIPVRTYLDSCGFKKLSDFPRLNPTWGVRAFVGLLLEMRDEMDISAFDTDKVGP